MRCTTFFALCAVVFDIASAGVIIAKVNPNDIVPNARGDCFFGVSTKDGCSN